MGCTQSNATATANEPTLSSKGSSAQSSGKLFRIVSPQLPYSLVGRDFEHDSHAIRCLKLVRRRRSR